MYSNQMGLDGDRLYYDGTAMIVSMLSGSEYSLLIANRLSTGRLWPKVLNVRRSNRVFVP